MNKLCSVMLCSRKRPAGMMKCIRSFYDSATGDNWEMLVWIDDDDTESIALIPEMRAFPRCRVFVGPKLGYDLIDRGYYTMMAYHSDATWVWITNDDMWVSGDWYGKLLQQPTEKTFCEPGIHGMGGSQYPNDNRCGAPIFRRDCWIEAGWLTIPAKADYILTAKLEEMGWTCRFLEKVRIQHDRGKNDEYDKHHAL